MSRQDVDSRKATPHVRHTTVCISDAAHYRFFPRVAMPPKQQLSAKTKAKYKKLLRKADNAALSAKMMVLRTATFDETGADRDMLADFPVFKSFARNGLDVTLHWYTAATLPAELKTAVFDLTKANMHDIYVEAGWGWNDAKKRAELADDAGRFIVAMGRPVAPAAAAGPAATTSSDGSADAVAAAAGSATPVRRGRRDHIICVLHCMVSHHHSRSPTLRHVYPRVGFLRYNRACQFVWCITATLCSGVSARLTV